MKFVSLVCDADHEAERKVTSARIKSRCCVKNVASTYVANIGCALWGCHHEGYTLLKCSVESNVYHMLTAGGRASMS